MLGDQLDRHSAAFDGFDPGRDGVWMAENATEATHVWCHKQRLVLFFSAMRHFCDQLRERDINVAYHALEPDGRHDSGPDFASILAADVRRLGPERLIVLEPGDWRVWQMLQNTADELGLPLEIRADRHFYCGIEEFGDWAADRKRLVLEDFYRHMRRTHGILMEGRGPAGGSWNYDADNRESFGRNGPGELPRAVPFAPDALTREVIELVATRFGDHPGRLDGFDQPVTADQARQALADFIAHRLAGFGPWQDALWTGADLVHHSRLSAALNLHLLDPREVVDAAVAAWEAGEAPLNSVEGFVRQILGWREFVRGIYWQEMPDYIELNALDAQLPVPASYWDGETEMACIGDAMRNVGDNGYAHHIQRLMILGLFAQLAGVHPRAFHDWHMAMYLDAIDWVSLPNTLGMSQFGDGGIVGTKPYCASGNYVNRMSNYCRGCRFDYRRADGDNACPITTLYWDFLDRHDQHFRGNRRMLFQVRNLKRKRENPETMAGIRRHAADLKMRIAAGERV